MLKKQRTFCTLPPYLKTTTFMAQSTRQIALHALWLRVITLHIKGYLLKAGGIGNRDSKVHQGGKTSSPRAVFCPLYCRVLPLVALEENSFWKAQRFRTDRIRECWCFKGAWWGLGSRFPFIDEKLRTREVFPTGAILPPREHLATPVNISGCHLARVGMLLSWIQRSQGCC